MLAAWHDGDDQAFERLSERVYAELHRRAAKYLRAERVDHTLGTSGLVHEAFIKLAEKRQIDFADRDHFFAVAAQTMRRILVDHARHRNREKRGGGQNDLSLEAATLVQRNPEPVDILDLNDALDRLAVFDKRLAQVVEMKYFGGMTLDEIAIVIGLSRETVKRDWQIARSWLRNQLT